MKLRRTISLLIPALMVLIQAYAIPGKKIIVSKDGKADFSSVQAAINSVSNESVGTTVIFIRKGFYNEKIYLERPNIVLEGEDRESTIISFATARDEWRCDHPDDWGAATLNVKANDITLKNLTITNSYGWDWKEDRTITCASDSSRQKNITRYGHQMALRTLYSTRLKAINCHFKALAGDTVSPWEVENGQWYFKDCIIEGGVDFYCPRGWAWAENCEFIAHGGTAAIWHDGSANEDAKTVLINCRFKGYDGFLLGRYHRDAQFYLINCTFASNMRDSAIYRVNTSNTIKWGHRVYYYNCHREGGNDFSWYADNLPSSLKVTDIHLNWIFKNKWNPELN